MQTNLAVSRLQGSHQFAISCNYAQEGWVGNWPARNGDIVRLLPKDPRVNDHGEQIIPYHAEDFKADAILTHYDAWVFDPAKFGRPWIPWYPVDCEDFPDAIRKKVEHAAMRIVQTRHAQRLTEAAGLDCEYVPAAYDRKNYRPLDGTDAKKQLGAEGRYLVSCIAANTGHPGTPHRKSYPQIFEGFALFLAHEPDAVLYLHTHQYGQIDLGALAKHYGIHNNIISANPYFLTCGVYSPDHMALLYAATDVLLSPSMGEGFGVPIVEAQACGTPVITGDWTAMSEITRTGIAIAKEDAMPYPIVTYGTMYIPRPEAIRDALIESTTWQHDPAEVSERVQEYEIEHVITEHWQPTLAKLEQRVAQPSAPGPNRAARRRMKLADQKEAVA